MMGNFRSLRGANTSGPVATSSLQISIEQLLELRHIPIPSTRTTPDSNGAWLGNFRSRKRGHGTDYDDLRPYSAGDDIRHIDWRASARTDHLHTRLYREEKEHRLSIVCDLRHCMFTGSQQLRATRAVILCARLLWLSTQSGTRVYLSILTQSGVCNTAPGSGHSLAIRGCALLIREYSKALQTLTRHHTNALTEQTKRTDTEQISDNNTVLPAATGATVQDNEHHALASDHPELGPSLTTLLRWLSSQSEQQSTTLWISALDYEGEQFCELLGEHRTSAAHRVIHMSDPLLQSPLRAGDYDYTSFAGHKKTARHALITRARQHALREQLSNIEQARVQRYDALRIPLLSNTAGDDAVIAQLRDQGVLA